jgi:hypothetical protein
MTTLAQSARLKEVFLAAFSVSGNVSAACRSAGISRNTAANWRKADPDFAAAYADAEIEAVEHLEAEARRRAVDGVDEPVFGKDGEIGTRRRYSDTLLMFLLNGAAPEKYRRGDTTVNIDNRTQVQADAVILQIVQARQQILAGGQNPSPGGAIPEQTYAE